MAKYAISSSGESSMRQLASEIKSFSNKNIEAGRKLKDEATSLKDGLGIYSNEIIDIVVHTQNSSHKFSESLDVLAQRILQKADEISKLVAMGLGGKPSYDEVNAEKSPQNVMWSDLEYGDASDKIRIANYNSSFLEWSGENGNSLRVPRDKSGKLSQLLKKYGVEGIPYVNGDVDFSQVAKYEIEFEDAEKLYIDLGKTIKFGDLMTDDAMKSRSEFNNIIRRKWQSMAKQQIVDRIMKDEQFARDFSVKTGVNTDVIQNVSNLDSELKINRLSLHETPDCKKIQLVSTQIHAVFKHAGGTAEMLERLINGDIHYKVSI